MEHVESDRLTETVQMNNVKIDNRIWRQQMLHNHIQNFQRQVYPVNPAIFQLLAGKVFHDQFYCKCFIRVTVVRVWNNLDFVAFFCAYDDFWIKLEFRTVQFHLIPIIIMNDRLQGHIYDVQLDVDCASKNQSARYKLHNNIFKVDFFIAWKFSQPRKSRNQFHIGNFLNIFG